MKTTIIEVESKIKYPPSTFEFFVPCERKKTDFEKHLEKAFKKFDKNEKGKKHGQDNRRIEA